MSAVILNGKSLAARIKLDLAKQVSALNAAGGQLGLGTILVGEDPGSHSYVTGKHRDCQEVGINSIRIDLPVTATESQILKEIKNLNENPACTGYIVQLPLPNSINTQKILEAIDPAKDADGLHPMNLGRLVAGYDSLLPCTPSGIIELLRHYQVPIARSEVVVIGRGLTVGRPLSLMLSRKSENATVTLAHTGTRDLAKLTKRSDIVIAAIGSAQFLKPEMVKPGAAVIDVGITRTKDGLIGDVDPAIKDVAGFFAPMPGGVGPMTRAMLLRNVVAIK